MNKCVTKKPLSIADRCAARTGQSTAPFVAGINLAASGQVEEAMAAYQKLVDINPENYGAWLGMAHALKTVGKQSESIEAYRRCIELKPDQGEPTGV